MRSFHSFLLFTGLTLCGMHPVYASNANDISKSLANPSRSDADRERDTRDRPQDVLELAGFKKGMVIADVFGGGGYYSEILSRPESDRTVLRAGRVIDTTLPDYAELDDLIQP